MRTLQRYVGRDVLLATLLIFIALLALFAFFDMIHELGDVGRGDYTISRALLFVTLNLPSRLYELFPIAALIGTLFAVAQLVANSEYTVMRASGMSLAQMTWSVLRVGIPLAAATFLAGEYVAPPAERIAQTVRASGIEAAVAAQVRTLTLSGKIRQPVERALHIGLAETGALQIARECLPLSAGGQLLEHVAVKNVDKNVENAVVHGHSNITITSVSPCSCRGAYKRT